MPDAMTAKAGERLRVEALISGKPTPVCKWKRGDSDVVPSSRLAVHKSHNCCVLIIKDVSRQDTGEYSLLAENSTDRIEHMLKLTIKGKFFFFFLMQVMRLVEIQYIKVLIPGYLALCC